MAVNNGLFNKTPPPGSTTLVKTPGYNSFSTLFGDAFTGGTGGKSSAKSSQKSYGGGGGSYSAAAPAPVDYTARLQGLVTEMSSTTFQPQTVTYTPAEEAALSEQIAAWLRPGYDRAIAERQERTRGYAAELTADAIARGMGASTYVTDVRSRQQRDEANDIAIL